MTMLVTLKRRLLANEILPQMNTDKKGYDRVSAFGARSLLNIGKRGSKQFFLKKNQKTFTMFGDAAGSLDTYRIKSKFFGSFFKKRAASFLACLLDTAAPEPGARNHDITPKRLSEFLRQPKKNCPPQSELGCANAHAGAVSNLVAPIEQIEQIRP
jgi:hypothetical protein